MAVITGTGGNDILRGTDSADVINALGGDDLIYPGNGSDLVDAGDGDDRVVVSVVSFDQGVSAILDGGAGHNTLDFSQAAFSFAFPYVLVTDSFPNNAIKYGSIYAQNFDHFVLSSASDYFTVGNVTIDLVLDGGPGNDLIATGTGNDILLGGDGEDTLNGGGGFNVLDGGSGVDWVTFKDGQPVSVDLRLGQAVYTGYTSGVDRLVSIENVRGTSLADTLIGDDGANVFNGYGGADIIDGGGGSDTISMQDSVHIPERYAYPLVLPGVNIDLSSQLAWDRTVYTHLTSIENAIGSIGGDYIIGDAGSNYLQGLGGNDQIFGGDGDDILDSGVDQYNYLGVDSLYGGNGNDILLYGGGNDLMDGGEGSDTVSFASIDGPVDVDLRQRLDSGMYVSIENLSGSIGNDRLTGDDSDNILDGGTGGADVLDGSNGSDTVSSASSVTAVTIDLAAQLTWDGSRNDRLLSIENAIGSRFDDFIRGDAGNNVLDGGAGGADTLIGNGGMDTVSYATSQRGVVVDLLHQLTWDGIVNDHLAGIGNASGSGFDDNLRGDALANVLDGGAGGSDTVSYIDAGVSVIIDLAAQLTWDGTVNDQLKSIENAQGTRYGDVLVGDAGANILQGLGGADLLTGGGGADRFLYTDLSDSQLGALDHILDFSEMDGDRVDVIALDGNSRLAGDQGFHFVGAFSGAAEQAVLYYDTNADTTTLSLDVNGDAVADFQLQILGHIYATSDFVF
ncbi:calcium-binding protein [Sphingomonas sp. R86521]|uniref:calcium-binding protein n=1 Tax=Sphingomonas sp. R86521 TaxID=3093860 RepID=UPI0036D40CB4